uniref:Tudor domain-containing protein 7B-like n=1 Tax=Sinocyclocheilus anshuiensis TaxID=1608454 RepID=A0A671LSJ2_9TELE
MADEELVKKMVRAVLQSAKSGVSLSNLQVEYKDLTGELIPYKQLGYATLDALLHSMPSVVKLDKGQSGEVVCHATTGNEMTHVTKLAARQRTAKRTGRPQVVNCQMRVKPAAPLALNARPRTSLRQPDHRGHLGRGGGRGGGHEDPLPRTGSLRDSQPDGKGALCICLQNKNAVLLFGLQVEKPCSTKPQELLLYPAKETSQIDVKQKLGDLLLKYSSGLWAHALPKLYQDTYKCKLPEFVLDHLTLLSDICTIDYPMPDNPKRAILYAKVVEDENRNQSGLAGSETKEAVERSLSSQTVPPLVIPREEYPSVLVVEAGDTNSVILRYIGEGYSKAQEKLEDEMREFYGQDSNKVALTSPLTGQLTAVCAEEEEEILRAQVCEVMANKVKVYYVDHGFSEVISKSKLFELHEKFYRLPFQATKCKLAGLESFSQEQAVLKRFESMATSKILLAEILVRQEAPLVVLYDTSQDDDININAACMKALQDKSLESPLKVNSAYMNVNVSSVCSDGTIYCQVPSRGLTKLNEILERTENCLHSQVLNYFMLGCPKCPGCFFPFYPRLSRVLIHLHCMKIADDSVMTEFVCLPIFVTLQALKCCLADLPVSVGSWTPDAVQWLRDTALHCSDCSLKIAKVDEPKRLAHVYLFTSKNFHDTSCSLNQQLADSNLWNHQKDVFLSSRGPSKSLNAPTNPATIQTSSLSTDGQDKAPHTPKRMSSPLGSQSAPPGSPPEKLALPPLLELPKIGQNLDVFVSVACHPGHFVLQPWHDMYKLVDLMGEMILHYNKMEEKPLKVEKNQVCAAKVENNWYRVLVKGVLTNGLVSVFQLDYGKHELVSCTQLRPLTQEFCQLPFQAITAQLAGVKPRQWSEEASIVFRNHVEKKPLVAQLESVQEASQPWDCKVVIFLVDTSQEERDIWLHDIMAEFTDEILTKLKK